MNLKITLIMLLALIVLLVIYNNPIKTLFKLAANILLGSIFLMFSNFILSSLGLNVAINLFTSSFSGILGLPGVVCLYILNIMI